MRSASFVLTMGLFFRGRTINAITQCAWERGLECSHTRAGNQVRFTVSGDARQMQIFLIGIQGTFEKEAA